MARPTANFHSEPSDATVFFRASFKTGGRGGQSPRVLELVLLSSIRRQYYHQRLGCTRTAWQKMTTADSKVALVTGAGRRRVGSFVAEALAARGYSLALHYRQSAQEAQAASVRFTQQGHPSIALQADLADEQAIRQLVSQVVDRFGRIDVLVNCAAIWERKRLEDVTADDVRRQFEINASMGTFLWLQVTASGRLAKAKAARRRFDRQFWRLGYSAALSELCCLLRIEGSDRRYHARDGRRAGVAESADTGELHFAGAGDDPGRSARGRAP